MKDYKFTTPSGYYEFTLTREGKTYTQIVHGKSLEDAQSKVNPDMWRQQGTIKDVEMMYCPNCGSINGVIKDVPKNKKVE